MRRRARVSMTTVVAGAATLALVIAGLNGPVAVAATADAPPIITSDNASDPFAAPCSIPSDGGAGLCLYTSHDLGVVEPQPILNYYPMDFTHLYFMPDNRPGTWIDKGVMFSESQYPWVPQKGSAACVSQGLLCSEHLWAPAMARKVGGTNPGYYLYVPDVSDKSSAAAEATKSRIGVSRSSAAAGPFTYVDYVHFLDSTPGADPPYMSDPEVFTEGSLRHLLWADGDGSNCGGLSMGPLASDMVTVDGRGSHPIVIDGVEVLGNCSGNPANPHPYLEGPSLYDFSTLSSPPAGLPGRYVLVFPAKPDHVPAECTTDKGQPGTDQEVIAWATSDAVGGHYTYRGILMCASSHEWTNQATIAMLPTLSGAKRMVMFHHDGQGAEHNRKLHAECLSFAGGAFSIAYRNWDGYHRCMSTYRPVSLRARANSSFVAADLTLAGQLVANRPEAGPWERFDLIQLDDAGGVAIRARANTNYLSAHTAEPNSPVLADATSVFVGERFRFVRNSDGTASLRAVNGLFVGVDPADPRRLLANYSSNATTQTRFDIVLPPGPTTVALKSKRNGMFVAADVTLSGRLIADRPEVGPWETFDLVDLPDGNVALRAHSTNAYVSADVSVNANGPLIANRTTPGLWETFTPWPNDDGSLSLRALANGAWVSADDRSDESLRLTASRPGIGLWEQFELVVL